MAFDSSPSANKAFNEVSSDLAELMAKYKIKPLPTVGGTLMHTAGAVGSPLMVIFSAKGAVEDASKGKYLDSAADIIPAIPEIADVGIGTVAFAQALKQGAWQATKAGATRIGAGAVSAEFSLGASLFLTLAVDVGQSRLHELGYKVDNGFSGTQANQANNINHAVTALFPTDTIPLWLDTAKIGTVVSTTSIGPDQQDVVVNYDRLDTDYDPEHPGPNWTFHIDQRGINGFERELDQFTTYRGHYQNKALNDLAQAMYDNPDQAKAIFKDCLYATTIATALENAQKAGETINGKGQPLGATDLIPQKYLDAAARQVLDGFRQDYKAAGIEFNTLHKELGQFGTFYGHYKDPELNTLAQMMYEHQDQADTLFENYMRTTIRIRALEDAKQAGVKNSSHHPLSWTDTIPQNYMEAAEKKVYSDVAKDYQENAATGYIDNALNYIDPRSDRHYTDPKNLDVTRIECARVLMTFDDGKGGVFHWDNPEHVRLMRGMLDQALLNDPQSTVNAPAAASRASHRAAAPAVAPLNTKLNEEQIHAVNQDVINQVISPAFLADENGGFDHAKINALQVTLAQAGYLSGTYHTGAINGYTMRAIDASVKAELKPDSLPEAARAVVIENTAKLYESLKEHPADPTSFDVRALNFQANAYLLGLYDGRLDGLGGTKTLEAENQFSALQQKLSTPVAPPVPDTKAVVSPAPALEQPAGP